MDSEKNSAVGASQAKTKTKSKGEKSFVCSDKMCKIFKIVIIALIALTIVGCVLMFVFGAQKDEYESYAESLISDALELSDYGAYDADFALGLKVFKDAINETSDEEKLSYIYVAEAKYSNNYYARNAFARELLNNESVVNNEKLKSSCFYREIDYEIAIIEDDEDKIKLYREGGCINEKKDIDE